MTVKEALAKLKSLADERMYAQNVKRGAGKNQFGVKMGDIRKIADKIKVDHALALELWKSDNLEAHLLAMLIVKPKELSVKQLDTLVKSITWVQEAEWFNSYILKEHPEREVIREDWMKSKNVWAARAGWSLMSGKVVREPATVDMSALLDRIEVEMPKAPTEVQWTMNTTLAMIGINNEKLRKRAIAIGEKLGVYRDYPVSKGCTSPFAPVWIGEMVRRKG